MFGLNFNSADQFCVLPIIECQTINRSNSQQEATIDACKKTKVEEFCIVQTVQTVHTHQYVYSRSKYSPSAPKSGLNDFFSLKFLNIFTTLLLSLIAYLEIAL